MKFTNTSYLPVIHFAALSTGMCSIASAVSIVVVNPSFEDDTAFPGATNSVGQAGPVSVGWQDFGRVQRFYPGHPDATVWPSVTVPDGQVLAGTQDGASASNPGGSGLYQDLAPTFVEGNTYTFNLEVGGGYETAAGNLTIAFTSTATDLNGTLLASSAVAFPSPGDNFVTNTVSYTALASDAGNPIRILIGTADVNQTMTFDNAEVDFVPEPTSLALLGLGGVTLLRRRRRY